MVLVSATLLFATATAAATSSTAPTLTLHRERSRDARLNVVMIAVDDLRPELAAYGHDHMHTPYIDALAAKSLLLYQAHVQQAVCSPTRTSLLTSRRPDHTHVYDLKTHFRDVGLRNISTLPEYFKRRNYTAVGMGKIFHPVVDRVTGLIDDVCTPTMHECSWTTMAKLGGQPYFHPPYEQYYQHGGTPPHVPGATTPNGSCPLGPCHNAGSPRFAECGTTGCNCGCPSHAAVSPSIEAACPLPGTALAAHAVETITRLATTRSNPFFVSVGFHKPHLPFIVPQRFLDLYPLENITLPRNPYAPVEMPDVAWSTYGEIRAQYFDVCTLKLSGDYNVSAAHPDDMPDAIALALRQHYYAAVSFTDDNVGRVMDAIAAIDGLAEQTVIALWGDHGWQLGEHGAWCKQTMWEIATRGTLMFHTPLLNKNGHGVRSHALAEFVDIYPTLVDIAGLTTVPRCSYGVDVIDAVDVACTDGLSLRPLWSAPNATLHATALSLYPRPNMNTKHAMGFSMVVRVNAETGRIIEAGESTTSGAGVAQFRYTEWVNITARGDPAMMLFDRHWSESLGVELYNHSSDRDAEDEEDAVMECFDCLENVNLASDSRVAGLVDTLSARLRAEWGA